MPAGAEGGTGRDGVAGARPFLAETFHDLVRLCWVLGVQRELILISNGTWDVEVTVMGRSF